MSRSLDDLTPSDVDAMSPEEVLLWYQKAQHEKQLEQAMKELKSYLDIRNAETHTIKLETE